MPKHPYLQPSGPRQIWSYRRVVPAELRPIISKSESVISLKTADLQAALPAYHEIALQTDAQFGVAKQRLATGNATGVRFCLAAPIKSETNLFYLVH